MGFFKRMIDFLTLGSDRPVRRLLAYYLVLAAVVGTLMYFFPVVDHVIGSAQLDEAVSGSQVLKDGLQPETIRGFDTDLSPRLELALSTLIIMLGVLVLMLPVSWVYMSTRYKGHNQQVAQTLIFLPLVVAGIVLVVQNSLALAAKSHARIDAREKTALPKRSATARSPARAKDDIARKIPRLTAEAVIQPRPPRR